MAKKWFHQGSDGSECGPYSGAELRNLALLGRVRRETPVRTDDRPVWVAAEQVGGLFGDSDPVTAPGAAQPTVVLAPRAEVTIPPVVPDHVTAVPVSPSPGLATGPAWDNVLEPILNHSSGPQTPSRSSLRTAAPPVRDATPDSGPTFGDFALDPRSTSGDRIRHHSAVVLRILTDPRDAFGEALSPIMQAHALRMIAASVVLYMLMWLPFFWGIEAERGRRGHPIFPFAREADPSTEGWFLVRLLSRMGQAGPRLLLAAMVSLGAVGLLGAFAAAALADERRPQPVRRGIAALGLSLTPLMCLLALAVPIGFVSMGIASTCAYLGVFVSVLYYHEALQAVGGIPISRAVYCTPVVFAIGAFLLASCTAVAGASLLSLGFPF